MNQGTILMNGVYQSNTYLRFCNGCGTCVGICPLGALKIKNDPKWGCIVGKNEASCNNCNLCYQVCPVNFGKSAVLFESNIENLIGGNVGCFSGYSTNEEIRYSSSSGGLVTQLLLYALESDLIDGALVTKMKKDSPLTPEPFIATTPQEIIEASKSKYCPVPVNVALKKILEKNGRFAVVGLPCHIAGVRKAEAINKKLRDRIVLHLGLFCSHSPSYAATKLFIERMNIEVSSVSKISYRGNGWPGCLRITLKDAKVFSIPLNVFWDFLGMNFLASEGCLICCDALNELSDISFGDAWLPEFFEDKVGTSIIIARNKVGESLLKNSMKTKKITLNILSPTKVVDSQFDVIYSKKKEVMSRWKLLGFPINPDKKKLGKFDYFFALFLMFNRFLICSNFFTNLLKRTPNKMLHAYFFMPNYLRSKRVIKEQGRILCDQNCNN
jgi:coenzyme F420 hydrogenase subunit beta